MTYECSICYAVNHSSRLHCSACGTIPAVYSILAKPTVYRTAETIDLLEDKPVTLNYAIEVYVAFGCERQMSRRTIRRTARTVPLDYYAEM